MAGFNTIYHDFFDNLVVAHFLGATLHICHIGLDAEKTVTSSFFLFYMPIQMYTVMTVYTYMINDNDAVGTHAVLGSLEHELYSDHLFYTAGAIYRF